MIDTEAAPPGAASVFVEMQLGQARGREIWRCWLPFGLLCVVASSRWILDEPLPQTVSTLRSEEWACWAVALVMGAAALIRRRDFPEMRSVVVMLAIGSGLLAAPSLGAVLPGLASAPLERTVALCFVPVMVAVMQGIWGEDSKLWPGLTGLGGALIVVPLAVPGDVSTYMGLLIPSLAVAAACVACRRMARDVAVEWCAALLLVGGGMSLALMDGWRGSRVGAEVQILSGWAVALDGLLAALLVLVVLRIDASRYVSRYFIVPLLTIIEGLVLLHEGVTVKLAFGLILLGLGAVELWRSEGIEAATGLGLN